VQASALSVTTGGGPVVVEADDDADSESTYESGLSSETTSVNSSVFSFVYANGRRYHSDRFRSASYFMPNDEGEQDRLDLFHHMFLSLLGGKLHAAPLTNPQRVLDVGTGTGIWAIDFADLYPEAKVIGTDLSPIQPTWVPPNLNFEIDDMEDEWTYQDNYFDFIHMRTLSGSFSDWDAILAQAYRKLTPGGYLEFQDYGCELFLSDGTRLNGVTPEHPLGTYMHHITSAAASSGRPLTIARGMAERMERAGFVDVQQQTAIWPVGPWAKKKELKELGKWGKIGMMETAHPFAVQLLTRQGWTVQQVKDMADITVSSLNKGKYYFQGWFIHGKKPEA